MNASSTVPNPGKTNATEQTAKAGNTAAGKFKLARGWGKSTTSALRLKSGKIDAVGQTKAAANAGTRPELKTKVMNEAQTPLPNHNNAKIDTRKLTDYALNPEHPVGGHKAKVFESALGYNKSNADSLMKQIYEKLPKSEAVMGKLDQYGQRYTVDMSIMGANGNTATVRTGWILKPGSTTPELTTIYIK
jgi:hypothetical protein